MKIKFSSFFIIAVLSVLTFTIFCVGSVLYINLRSSVYEEFLSKVESQEKTIGIVLKERISNIHSLTKELKLNNSIRVSLILGMSERVQNVLSNQQKIFEGLSFFVCDKNKLISAYPEKYGIYYDFFKSIFNNSLKNNIVLISVKDKLDLIIFAENIFKKDEKIGTIYVVYDIAKDKKFWEIIDNPLGTKLYLDDHNLKKDLFTKEKLDEIFFKKGVLHKIDEFDNLFCNTPNSFFNNKMAVLKRILFYSIIAVLFFSFLVIFVIVKIFSKSLKIFTKQINNIIDEDVVDNYLKISNIRFFEFQDLGKSFNKLLKNLYETQEKLNLFYRDEMNEVENRFHLLVNNLHDGVIWVQNEKIVYVNESILNILGYEKEEILNQNFKIIFHKNDRDFIVDKYHRRQNGEILENEYEYKLISKDGICIFVHFHIELIEVDGIVTTSAIIKDLTADKQAEQKRKDLEKQIRQSDKMQAIGTLVGGIAHDFNNILTAIMGYSYLLFNKAVEDSREKKYTKRIMDACERAKKLIEQILTFSTKAEKDRHALNIKYTIKEALKLVKSTFPSNIKIVQSCNDALVLADTTQIHQLIMNLVTNSLFAIGEDNLQGQIRIDLFVAKSKDLDLLPTMKSPQYACLFVEDNGCGINDYDIERIFDPYFTTKGDNGTGLGLSIVHGIVKNHKGFIFVESQIGEGTKMKIFLPIAERERKEKKQNNKIVSLEKKGSGKILVVDDDGMVLGTCKEVLENSGYEVTTMQRSSDALDLFERGGSNNFDLIVTDLIMPDVSGISLAKKILAIKKGLPIILITGDKRTDLEKIGKDLYSGKLQKPFDGSELIEIVNSSLS